MITGNSTALSPTHQLTVWCRPIPIRAAPKAAGLNKWRLLIATMYFEAIAQADTSTRKATSPRLPGAAGVRIRVMMSALIETDSQLLPAPKAQIGRAHV